MSKTGYMIFRRGEIWGVLESKKEFKRFKEQRNMNLYDVIKLPMDEIEEKMAYRNITNFHTVTLPTLEEYIVFQHEECYVAEVYDLELTAALEITQRAFESFKKYIIFDEDELILFNASILILGKLLLDESHSIRLDYVNDRILNLEQVFLTWLQGMNDEDD